jgi:hypothetical protein
MIKIQDPCFLEFIQDSMLQGLNNPKYFDDKELFEAFKVFLSTLGDQNGVIWSSILEGVFSLSWAPIPLFHVIRALEQVSGEVAIQDLKIDIIKVKNFVSFSMKCQEPLIRGKCRL